MPAMVGSGGIELTAATADSPHLPDAPHIAGLSRLSEIFGF